MIWCSYHLSSNPMATACTAPTEMSPKACCDGKQSATPMNAAKCFKCRKTHIRIIYIYIHIKAKTSKTCDPSRSSKKQCREVLWHPETLATKTICDKVQNPAGHKACASDLCRRSSNVSWWPPLLLKLGRYPMPIGGIALQELVWFSLYMYMYTCMYI